MKFGPSVPTSFTCPDCCSASRKDCKVGFNVVSFNMPLKYFVISGGRPNIQAGTGFGVGSSSKLLHIGGWEPT